MEGHDRNFGELLELNCKGVGKIFRVFGLAPTSRSIHLIFGQATLELKQLDPETVLAAPIGKRHYFVSNATTVTFPSQPCRSRSRVDP